MKDIEKIKSEDLGCQVQDANPANFAIEQEVAQLVGATVPAPTEPSADDARELGAQLLVFLRRALTPIRSALRTAVAAIYAHLDSRCTDYTPAAYAPYQPLPSYDPMGTPPTPRTVANILTALTAFSARKISNGSAPSDGIPDGTSLVNLLCGGYADVVELKDDNTDWTWTRENFAATLASIFPNAKKWTLGCKLLTKALCQSNSTVEHLIMSGLRTMQNRNTYIAYYWSKLKRLDLPVFEGMDYRDDINYIIATHCDNLEEVIAPNWVNGGGDDDLVPCTFGYNAKLRKVQVGKIHDLGGMRNWFYQCPLLEDVEFADGVQWNTNLSNWNPTNVLADADKTATFLQNFKEHIALRLTANGTGLTLTLSQAVFDTIWNQDGTPKSTDPDSVIYQINKIIKTDKHWSVNRA